MDLIQIDDILQLLEDTTSKTEMAYNGKSITKFIENFLPDSLVWVIDNGAKLFQDLDSVPISEECRVLIIIKQKGQVSNINQLNVLMITHSQHEVFDKLRAIINLGLLPIFKSTANNDSFVNVTRKLFNELLASLHNLEEKVQVPDLLVSVHPTIKQLDNDNFTEYMVQDTNLLNEVTVIVNGWISQIQSVTNLQSNIQTQLSVADEIEFWTSLDISLSAIESQINSIHVKNSIALLNRAKRFHVTLGFTNDTNLSAKSLEAKLNLLILKDLPISELTHINPKDADSIATLKDLIQDIFNHLKKLRTLTFPLDRALMLIELCLKDIENKLLEILTNGNLPLISLNDFLGVYHQVLQVFDTIDLNIKYMINLIRELLRKRHEKFIIIKINQDNINLARDFLEEFREFRLKHENLLFIIRNFLKSIDEEANITNAYTRLSLVNPFDLSKHGQLTYANSKQIYDVTYNNIQNFITMELNSLFANCQTVKDYIVVADNYKSLTIKDTFDFLVLMKEDLRIKILDTARAEVNRIIKFDAQQGSMMVHKLSIYENSSESGLDIKAQVLRAASVSDKLGFYENSVLSLVGPDWNKYSTGKKLEEQINVGRKKHDPQSIIGEFMDSLVQYIAGNKVHVKGKVLQRVNSQIRLNFDNELLVYKDALSFFTSAGFKVPANMALEFQTIDKLVPLINEIHGNLGLVQRIFEQVLAHGYGKKYEYLVEDEKQTLYEIFKKLNHVHWEYLSQALDMENIDYESNLVEVQSLKTVLQFLEFLQRFTGKLNVVAKLNSTLSLSYHQLRNCNYTSNTIKLVLDNVRNEVLETYSYDNVNVLCKLVDDDIGDILCSRINNELQQFTTSLKSTEMLLNIDVIDNPITLTPSMERIKIQLISEINNIITTVDRQRLLASDCTVSQVSFGVASAVKAAEAFVDDIRHYYLSWKQIDALIRLDCDTDLESFVDGTSLEAWNEAMNCVVRLRSNFYSSTKIIGRAHISLESVQARVSLKFDSFQATIVQKFAQEYQQQLGRLEKELTDAIKQLGFHMMDPSRFLSNMTAFVEMNHKIKLWKQQQTVINESSQIFTKFQFTYPSTWIYADQIDNQLTTLVSLVDNKRQAITENQERINSRLVNDSNELFEKMVLFKDDWYSKRPISGDMKPVMVLNTLTQFQSRCEEYFNTNKQLTTVAKEFGISLPQTNNGILDDIYTEIQDFQQVWRSISVLQDQIDAFSKITWKQVKPRDIRLKLERLLEECRHMPIKIRQYAAFDDVQQKAKQLMRHHKYVVELKNDYLKDRHWSQILASIGHLGNVESLVLGDIWNADLETHEHTIRTVIAQAVNEHTLQESIDVLTESWSHVTFEFFNFNSQLKLVKAWDGLYSKCTEDLAQLQSMASSASYAVFERQVTRLVDKLNAFHIILDIWIDVQRQYVYLEGIFGSSNDLAGFLPIEATRFTNLTFEFHQAMRHVYKAELALDVLAIPEFEATLGKLAESFARLKRSLADFLERQRSEFARFYFVGNEDLLELMGSGGDFSRINSHVTKIFAGVAKLHYDPDTATIGAIESKEGEVVALNQPVSLANTPSLIAWLKQLDVEIKLTLSQLTRDSVPVFARLYTTPLEAELDGIIKHVPGQVINICSQIGFTTFRRTAPNVAILQQLITWLGQYMFDPSALARQKAQNLLVELIHQRDVLQQLEHDASALKFELVYEFDDTSDLLANLHVKMFNYRFVYGYEYHGVPPRLVYTPLMTRCFAAMVQAVGQKLGGSPFGPAGTGKTETVKALGEHLGRLVTIFCCDETFDVRAMGRIFLGVCKIGCWGCFDEFNRLDENILSAVSSQIESIEVGLKHQVEIELSGTTVAVHADTGIFVTMNPGYVGRNQLPENLKKLFRSFSMDVPDKELIVDVLLASQGFGLSLRLASLIVPLFSELQNQCSAQTHYDFGLRALKGMLSNCATLKRQTTLSEELVILKSVHETILPKLTKDDEHVFYSLVDKYFAGVSLDMTDDEALLLTLQELCDKQNLSFGGKWKQKVLQLNQLLSHHGVIMVGDSGTGKSSCRNVLLTALEQITGIPHEQYVIDAKVLNKKQLYGTLDYDTREWHDGLLTRILRRIKTNLRGERNKVSWIVFDGDIDPEWAENLNSVLDDNKTLTLPNGERLVVPANVHILFETDNLNTTTPATVSRCGMIWFEHGVLDTAAVFASKIHKVYELNEQYGKLCNDTIKPILSKVVQDANAMDHIMDFNIHRSLNSLMVFLTAYKTEYQHGDMTAIALALVWSFAGDGPREQRDNFAAKMSAYLGVHADILGYDVATQRPYNVPFTELEPQKIAEPNTVVPTIDTLRHERLIKAVLSQHSPLLLCGPPGSGKTMTFLQVLHGLPYLDVLQLNFSKESSPQSLMKSLQHYCEYHKSSQGLVFKPKAAGKWVVVFCDEINLPGTDKYGSQPVISLLKQMIEYNGYWDREQWVAMQNIQFVGACNSPNDPGRHALSARFLRHVTLVMVDYPGHEAMQQIYDSFVTAVMKRVPELKGYAGAVTKAMIEVYEASRDHLSHVQPHYIYSPRELTRWVRGLYEAVKTTAYRDLEPFIRLWYHEGLRLFYDRLVCDEHRQWTTDLFATAIATHFPFKQPEMIMRAPVLFSDWLSLDYASVDRGALQEFVSRRLATFCEEETDVDVVLYESLLGHALQIDRVLRQPQGHMILVGAPTGGKTTVCKFVAWMNGLKVVELHVHSQFTITDFDKQLRAVLTRCVAERICYVIDESSILDTAFVERMNTLLANSEVPGLFEGDEHRALMELCAQQAQAQGLLLDTPQELYAWFCRRIAANLHVVFTLSGLQETVIASPALFNRCVLSYMGDWSAATLAEVAAKYLQDLPVDSDLKARVVACMVCIHQSVASCPGKFVALVQGFVAEFDAEHRDIDDSQRHTATGLDKLRQTVVEVADLKAQLSGQQTALQHKDTEARDMLTVLLAEQNEAERKQEFSLSAQEELSKQEREIAARRQVVMRDLAAAAPAVVAAREGVQNIKKQHLTEIRSMANPPAAVKMAMEAVCILLGYNVATWKQVQHAVRGDDFIANIVNYTTEHLAPQTKTHMEDTYLARPEFSFDAVNRASKACGPLVLWVRAQLTYAGVLETIGPLQREVQALEAGARKTKAQLHALRQMVTELEASIEHYKLQYSALIRDTETIKMEMEKVQHKVDKSTQLMERLTAEKDRWQATVAGGDAMYHTIVGNALLATACHVYLGEFDQQTRNVLETQWRRRLRDEHIAFDALLRPEIADENLGIISASTVPLIVDPSSHVVPAVAGLTTTSFLRASFRQDLENAVRFGGALLVRDCDHYDPILNLVLRHQVYRTGGRAMIHLGTRLVDFDPKFRLFLHTRDYNIHVPSFVRARVTLVNFTVTAQSLESQIMNLALKLTRPEVELKRSQLLALQARDKARLKQLEVTLLESIGEVKSILDDDTVMENLEQLKDEANAIDSQMRESAAVLDTMDDIRNQYSDVAQHSSLIYSILHRLSDLHPLYRFTLLDYTHVFCHVMQHTHQQKRTTADLILGIYREIFATVSPSLLDVHKIVFAVELACLYHNLDIGNHFTDFFTKLINILIRNEHDHVGELFEILVIKDVTMDNVAEHLDDNPTLDVLKDLVLMLTSTTMDWTRFATGLRSFTAFLFSDTEPYTSAYGIDKFMTKPIILASHPGYDATFHVEALAKTKNQKLEIVALGSNEGVMAVHRLRDSGDWVLLQNVQMSPEWLTRFDVAQFKHPNCKLFMTTTITAALPHSLVEDCKVLVYQTQPSFKNLLRQLFQYNTTYTPEQQYVYFLLCWYHCLVLARLKYAPVSFSKAYDINESDLHAGINALDNILLPMINNTSNLAPDSIPWDSVCLVVGEIIYGGKVDSRSDQQYLIGLSKRVFQAASFDPHYNLIQNPLCTETLYRPDGINNQVYDEWIDTLPNDIPLSWIELKESINDALLASHYSQVCSIIGGTDKNAPHL